MKAEDLAYKRYCEKVGLGLGAKSYGKHSDYKHSPSGTDRFSKEEFVNKLFTEPKFAEKWSIQ